MTLQRWHKEALGGLVIAVVFGLAGRFSGPTKVVTTEKVVTKTVVDQAAVAAAVASAKAQWAKEVKDRTVTKIIYREGKPVEKIVYVGRDTTSGGSSEAATSTTVATQTHQETSQTATETKKEEFARPNYSVGLMAKLRLGYPDTYAAQVDYRLFGPLWLAGQAQFDPKAWGQSAAFVGLKLEF